MRLRLLAFVPLAALIAVSLLIIASSFVSALETRFVGTPIVTLEIHRYETDCDRLQAEIQTLSQSATNCDEDLLCLGSPILCPIAMDAHNERRVLTLREELEAGCGFSFALDDEFRNARKANQVCASTLDWLDSGERRESREPATFVF